MTIRNNTYDNKEEPVTRKETDSRLKRAGWKIQHGANHDLAISPDGRKVALPRHKGDLKKGTALNILKYAGILD